jgi:Kef-type K+ transport system membrane component KefB
MTPPGTHEDARLFVEIGAAIILLALLARLASRWGFSAIPLYLLLGLAFGNGRTIVQNTRANQSPHPTPPKKWAYAIHSLSLVLNAASAIEAAKSSSAVATFSVMSRELACCRSDTQCRAFFLQR